MNLMSQCLPHLEKILLCLEACHVPSPTPPVLGMDVLGASEQPQEKSGLYSKCWVQKTLQVFACIVEGQ